MKFNAKVLLTVVVVAFTTIVYADLEVVVSAKSPVGNLTKQQVSDLFLGKAATYPDGNQAVPIEQADTSPQKEEFHKAVTGKTGAQLKAYWSRQTFSGTGAPPKEVPGAADVKKLISANPNMIGYIDKASVDGSVKVVLVP